MADLITWILGGLGGVAAIKASQGKPIFGRDPSHGVLTPARKDSFERAMRLKASKEQYYDFAEQYESAGLPTHAKLLRARGDSREATPELHEKRREMIRAAFRSRDPFKVEQFADVALNQLGMTHTATKLREYAKGLREAGTLRHEDQVVGSSGSQVGVEIKGDGGNLASATQLAGDVGGIPGKGPSIPSVESVSQTKEVPPPIEELPPMHDPFAPPQAF